MILDEFTHKVSTERAILIEERIRLILKPKPAGMSEKLYNAMIAELIEIECSVQH